MTNKSQLSLIFRKTNIKINRKYFQISRIHQRMIQLQTDWSIHPGDKLKELAKLQQQKSILNKEIQKLRDSKIIISCG